MSPENRDIGQFFIDYLTSLSSSKTSGLTDDKKDTMEAAIQCLESVFETERTTNAVDQTILDYISSKLKSTQKKPVSAEDADRGEVYKSAGNEAMRSGKYEDAIKAYTSAIEANPENAIYYCNRACAYSRIENHMEAIKDCEKAISLDANYGKAYGRLGIAYSSTNRFAEAKEAYATALKFDPGNVMYETNMKLADERLKASSQPLQNPFAGIMPQLDTRAVMDMASNLMGNQEFMNLMGGLINSAEANNDTFLQMSQNLASNIQNIDSIFMQDLRSALERTQSENGTNPTNDPQQPPQPPTSQ